MARRLAGVAEFVLETDVYFYTEVGADPASHDYSEDLLPKTRAWNLVRFRGTIKQEVSPMAVDRGNGLNWETRKYAFHAVEQGYAVELAEPDSPWWQELRVLLKHREHVTGKLFAAWTR